MGLASGMPHDARPEKIDLCRCHTKRRMGAPILLLVWHRLYRIWLCWHHRLYCQKVGVMPKEGWAWPHVIILGNNFGMTVTKTLRSVFSWRTSHYHDILFFACSERGKRSLFGLYCREIIYLGVYAMADGHVSAMLQIQHPVQTS